MRINRKKFLEMTAAFAGSSVMATHMPWFSIFNHPAPDGKGAADRVRIGVIGVGSRGSALTYNLQELAKTMNLEIAAVCDNFEKAKEIVPEADAYMDYRKMIESTELDGVVIATPLHEHAQMTVDCLQAGIHVYCEKAMARHLDDVKRMYDTHLEEDKILMIGHQRLFNPIYLDAMDKLEKGDIGPITMLRGWWHRNTDWVFYENTGGRGTELDKRLNWRFYDETSAGMISELGSHHFQVANWVLGETPESVVGHGSINFFDDGREVYDNFALVFRYPNGIHFSYDCITSNKHNGMQVQVLGNDGTMELESNMWFEEFPSDPPSAENLLQQLEDA
jgi:predicted dehydrogenase